MQKNPSIKEKLAAMEVIQHFVHHNFESFELQYRYKKFVNNLTAKNMRQTKIGDFL